MILSKFVEIKIGSANINYYKNLGYNAKCKTKLLVSIENLQKGSKAIIDVACDCCDKNKQISYQKYNRFLNKRNEYTCSKACNFKLKTEVEIKEINDKKEKASIIKYGVTHPNKTIEARKKQKEIMDNKTQEEWAKIKRDTQEAWGRKTPEELSEIKTNRNNAINSKSEEELKEIQKIRVKSRFIDKTSEELEQIKKKTQTTWSKKTAKEIEEIINKREQANLLNNGSKNPMHNIESFNKMRKSSLKILKHENTQLDYQGTYEAHFLDFCFKNKIKIEEFLGSIKYKFKRKECKYYPDFYLKKLNLIIEIKSDYTYRENIKRNLAKQKACIKLGYNFLFVIDKNYEEFINII